MAQDTDKHRITAVDSEGNKVDEPVLINGSNPLAGGGGGGAFVDEDGDGDAELQTQGADFQGKPAKNIGALSTDEASIGQLGSQLDANSNNITNIATADISNLLLSNVGGVAYLSTVQSVPASTTTQVDLDTTEFDHESEFDSANNEFVIADDGTYLVQATAKFNTPPDQTLVIATLKQNGTAFGQSGAGTSGGYDHTLNPSGFIQANSGDTIKLDVYHDAGSSMELKSGRKNTNISLIQFG